MDDVLAFVEGPLWYVALVVFVAGAAWRLWGILRLRRPTDLSVPRGPGLPGAVKAEFLHFIPHGGFTFRTRYHLVAGYAFHIGLLVVIVGGAAHIEFIKQRILGFGWPALPDWAFLIAAEVAFAGLILLWIRRISDPVMRRVSDRDDHLGTLLTFLVMLTGCFALAGDVVALRAIHMASVDLWLIYFPFSRLMHAFTFVLSRGTSGATFGRRGITP